MSRMAPTGGAGGGAASPDRVPLPPELESTGVIAIGRRLARGRIHDVADAFVDGGIRLFEVTLNDPEASAVQAIRELSNVFSGRLVIGAGTVMSIDAAERAVDAGATFLVMPHTDVELIRWATVRRIPSMPGAFSPTEALTAWRAGATAVKVFPASSLGSSFVREMRGPFPYIPLIPTGGISGENASAFIAAGARAVGLGGWLIGDGDAAGIRRRASDALAAIARARSEPGEPG